MASASFDALPSECVCVWRTCFLKKDFIYLFLERAEGREKDRERNINVWLPLGMPTKDLDCNPDMCRDWNGTSNPLVHRSALSPVSHQPGQTSLFSDASNTAASSVCFLPRSRTSPIRLHCISNRNNTWALGLFITRCAIII